MRSRPHPIERAIAAIGVALCLLAPATAGAQTPETNKTAVAPCCGIVRIDTERSIITARDMSTGYTFRVEVRSRKVLATLKVGDKVWVDFATKRVRLATGDSLCCSVLDSPAVTAPRKSATP